MNWYRAFGANVKLKFNSHTQAAKLNRKAHILNNLSNHRRKHCHAYFKKAQRSKKGHFSVLMQKQQEERS